MAKEAKVKEIKMKEVTIKAVIDKDCFERMYKTLDYDKFSFIKGNRDIVRSTLLNIINSIIEIGYQKMPIQVKLMDDGTFGIIDGQHRIEVVRLFEKGDLERYGIKEIKGFKKMKLPIYYLIMDNPPLSIISRLNTTRRWTLGDFIKLHEATGNEHYQRLLKINEMFPDIKNMRLFINMARAKEGHFTPYGGIIESSVRKGEFEFNNFDEAVKLCEQIMDFKIVKKNFKNSPWGNYLFYASLLKVMRMPNYDHKYVFGKIEKRYTYVVRQNSMEDYITLLQNIINYKSHNPVDFLQYFR